MNAQLWGLAAVGAGIGAVGLGAWVLASRPGGPALDEEVPATPLQKLARLGLALGALLTVGAAGLVAVGGPIGVFERTPLRLSFWLLVLGVLAVLAFVSGRAWLWARREDGMLDERDRGILSGAHALQPAAILVTLAVWTVGLQERYSGDGQMPLELLGLVFWSCVVVCVLALPLGILLGYRRS